MQPLAFQKDWKILLSMQKFMVFCLYAMQPKNKQKRSSKVAKNRLVLDHRNCSLCDLCIMVLIVELMTIWRTQEQKVGVFQDYFVFPFPKIRIFEISSNPYYLGLCSCFCTVKSLLPNLCQ